MSLVIHQVEVGLMQNFNYLVADTETRECAYVDPAWEVDRLLKLAASEKLKITQIWLTHHHFDHVEGVAEVVEKTGSKVFVHELDRPEVDLGKGEVEELREGIQFSLGKLSVKILHTPGHTPGSVCYLVTDPAEGLDHLITGDTLFQGNCGRSDLPGGDTAILFQSLQRIKALDPVTKIYPGHDYGSKPVTTVGYEKAHNPTLLAGSLAEFGRLP